MPIYVHVVLICTFIDGAILHILWLIMVNKRFWQCHVYACIWSCCIVLRLYWWRNIAYLIGDLLDPYCFPLDLCLFMMSVLTCRYACTHTYAYTLHTHHYRYPFLFLIIDGLLLVRESRRSGYRPQIRRDLWSRMRVGDAQMVLPGIDAYGVSGGHHALDTRT